jgi:hypothetical protein
MTLRVYAPLLEGGAVVGVLLGDIDQWRARPI